MKAKGGRKLSSQVCRSDSYYFHRGIQRKLKDAFGLTKASDTSKRVSLIARLLFNSVESNTL